MKIRLFEISVFFFEYVDESTRELGLLHAFDLNEIKLPVDVKIIIPERN